MTVAETWATEWAPVPLAREALNQADMIDDGAPRNQLAQAVITLERALRELLAHIVEATVTEYGVRAWSKYHGTSYVDPCDDLESALSTLQTKRQLIDKQALLVFRQVTAPRPLGEWRAVSHLDVAAALKTKKPPR